MAAITEPLFDARGERLLGDEVAIPLEGTPDGTRVTQRDAVGNLETRLLAEVVQVVRELASETFELAVSGLGYTCTVSRYADGRIAEIFLTNHKSNSAADTSALPRSSMISFVVLVLLILTCGGRPMVS